MTLDSKMLLTVLILMCGVVRQAVYTSVLKSDTDKDARIFGGLPIQITSAPYQVSVRLKYLEAQAFGYGHICGGSVISRRAVVTAAHCMANNNVTPMVFRAASEFTLVMGDAYLYYRTAYTLQFNVLQVVHNAAFDIKTLVNDIALFFINGEIPVNYPTVSPIALSTTAVAANTLCLVSGWGKVNQNSISNVLMQASVPIVSNAVCSTNYGLIPQSMVCAGYMNAGGVDACQGDSGGPLVCNQVLVGIVSWGNECALPGYPGVYTNAMYFDSWIRNTNASFNYSYFSGGSAVPKVSFVSIFIGFVFLVSRVL